MDSDNSVSRLERTFWAVWYYITDAVNRFLRPEPPQTASSDANSLQDSSVDSEHPISGNADVGISKEEDEEQPLATASLLSSSQQVVSWDVCTTDTDLGPEIDNMQYKTQLSRSSEGKASEDGEATREEQFNQTGSNDADLLLSRDEEEKEDENADLNLYGDGRDVMLKNDEQLKSGSAVMTDILQDEGMEETGKNTDDEERTGEVEEEVEEEEDHKDEEFTDYCRSYKLEAEESEVKLTEQSNMSTEEEKVPMDDADTTWAQIEVNNSDYMLHQASGPGPENQLSVCKQPSDDDTDSKGAPSMTLLDTVPHVELQMTDNNCGVVSDDALTVVGPEQTMADRSEGLAKSKAEEDHKEEEEENEVDEREHGAEEKEHVNEVTDQTKDEESEQEEDNEGLTESSQQDDIIAEGDSEGFTLNVKAEQHNNGGKNGEQAMTNENNDVMTKAISVNEELFDINNDREDEERLYCEEENKDDYMEQPYTSTLDTFEQHEGQEKCQANIPLGRREGQGVVSPELNSTTYKETQEGVPEYNNEPEPDGNTTQRFLEAGDYMECQTTQLPEEVESNTQKSLQNSNNSSGADYLLVREHMEEEQQPETKGTEVLRNVFVEENTGILNLADDENKRPLTEPAVHELGHLSEDKIGHLLDSPMKTGVKYFEEEFETHFGSDNDTDKTTKDDQEELLVELEINKGLCEAVAAEGETTGPEATGEAAVLSDCTMTLLEDKVTKMTETSVDDSCKTYTVLQKDITESGFLKNSTETEAKAPEDSCVEIQDAGIDMEEDTCGDVEQTKETENITQKEIIKLQEVEVVAEITTEKENAFKTAFGLTEYTNTEAKSDNALDFSNNEMVMKPEVVQESIKTESQAKDTEDNLKHVTESEGGYTSDSISVPQDAIDEEILDLWIQTALSEDPDDLKQQEEAGPGNEMATEVDTSSGRGDLTLCVQPEEKEKEKEVEVKLSESQPFSDPNASSFTAELGFLDQSLDGWGIQNNNTQLLESSLSLPDSMLANVSSSANTSELSIKQPGFEDVLIEETADTGQSDLKEGQVTTETGFHSDSVSRHLSQGLDELPEKTGEQRVESVEAETGSHPQTESNQVKETSWKDIGEADVESLKKIRSAFEEELTKADDEPLETPGSPDSPDEVVDTDSGRSSETGTPDIVPVDTSSLNPEHMLLKLPSLDEPQLDWSEPDEPEPGLKTDDQPQPGDQVDARVLDFTPQRSRIAVKNRRVRPPKDPRSLLHKPSVDPSPSTPPPAKIPVGVPLGGLGIGIKLPGLGAGLPVLKKTQKAVREENHPDTSSQEPETKPEKDDDDTPKRDTSQHKPKWMPPGHPGFGNPLMSELKTKLKKTTKE